MWASIFKKRGGDHHKCRLVVGPFAFIIISLGFCYSGFEASDSDNEDHDVDGFSSIQDEKEAQIEVQDESAQSEVFKNGNGEERNKTKGERSSEEDAVSDDEGQDENPDVQQQEKR